MTVRNALHAGVRDIPGERTMDELFDVLSHRYRRHALVALRNRDGPTALADLAVDVAERETDEPSDDGLKELAREIEISLYHVHVPKLADAEFVEFDRDRNTVRIHDGTTQSV